MEVNVKRFYSKSFWSVSVTFYRNTKNDFAQWLLWFIEWWYIPATHSMLGNIGTYTVGYDFITQEIWIFYYYNNCNVFHEFCYVPWKLKEMLHWPAGYACGVSCIQSDWECGIGISARVTIITTGHCAVQILLWLIPSTHRTLWIE